MLPSAVWPTPQSRDHKSGQTVQDYGNARPLSEAVHKALFPTPSATAYGSSGNGSGNNVASRGRPSLERMAKSGLWPTPTRGDGNGSGSRNTPGSKAHQGESLTDAVRGDKGTGRTDYNKLAGEMRAKAIATSGTWTPPRSGLSLNPSWVEWLMGWPIGWTDCAPLATDKFRRWWSAHGGS